MTLSLPSFRADQWRIAKHPAKIKVIACGRRWGKTTLIYMILMSLAALGGHVAYIVPEYRNGRAMWRMCLQAVEPLARDRRAFINNSERTIRFVGGGSFGIYSADNEDSIRGEAFHLVAVDEAPYISQSAWTDAIMPTLADYNGSAFILGTPKGQNWFYHEFQRGLSLMNEEQASWNAPSSANPNPHIQQAFMAARERVSDRTFRQEWLAQFIADGGEVFKCVDAVSTGKPGGAPQDGHTYVGGLDWGQETDYTVLSIFDAAERRQVALYRFNGLQWASQRARIRDYCTQWRVSVLRPEYNSIGNPNIEELRREFRAANLRVAIQPFNTTNQSKADAVEALALEMEKGRVTLLDDPTQKAELKAFTSERTPNGATRYAAPSGMHDDTVMATLIAFDELTHSRANGGIHI